MVSDSALLEAIERVSAYNVYSPRLLRFERLLEKTKESKGPISKAVSEIENLSKDNELQIYYFGGFLRDIWLGLEPRDIDITYNKISENSFLKHTSKEFVRRNSFGGLKLLIKGVSVDAWPIEDTHSFVQNEVLPSSVNNLVETTFFTLESIALEVYAKESRWGFEKGFFRACENKEIEINNPNNPFPSLQLARTYSLQQKLGWKLGAELKIYVETQLKLNDKYKIASAYKKHYNVSISPELILRGLKSSLK